MSKRSELLKSLYTPAEGLSADNLPKAPPRASSGSVKTLSESFSSVERENDELRDRIAKGAVIVELDPSLITPSPVADRFVDADEDSFDALKASIAERGQQVPVLVREFPKNSGRYQSAYGHRRIRAARDLGIQVKAVVRELSDDDLVVAQGVENSAREDLSFIERAVFAAKLIDAGHSRAVVQSALAVDKAEVSKLLAVTEAIPGKLIESIGRAPKVGRGRWQDLAGFIGSDGAMDRIRKVSAKADFLKISSDDRFARILQAASKAPKVSPGAAKERRELKLTDGTTVGYLDQSLKVTKLIVDHNKAPGFSDFLMSRMPELLESYAASRASDKSRGH